MESSKRRRTTSTQQYHNTKFRPAYINFEGSGIVCVYVARDENSNPIVSIRTLTTTDPGGLDLASGGASTWRPNSATTKVKIVDFLRSQAAIGGVLQCFVLIECSRGDNLRYYSLLQFGVHGVDDLDLQLVFQFEHLGELHSPTIIPQGVVISIVHDKHSHKSDRKFNRLLCFSRNNGEMVTPFSDKCDHIVLWFCLTRPLDQNATSDPWGQTAVHVGQRASQVGSVDQRELDCWC